jgi:serine/threonine protein kinase
MHLYGFYDDSKYFSLVTEIVDGGELFDRIVAKQHYNEHIAREFVKIFLLTLDFLHSNGIVHRGLLPQHRLFS